MRRKSMAVEYPLQVPLIVESFQSDKVIWQNKLSASMFPMRAGGIEGN